MKINFFFIVMLPLCLLFSCKSKNELPDCPDSINVGPFEMLESSLELFPYQQSNNRVIFSDSLGNEIIGNLRYEPISSYVFRSKPNCIDDRERTVDVNFEAEYRAVEIYFDSLDHRFLIQFSMELNSEKYNAPEFADRAMIRLIDKDLTESFPTIVVLLDQRASTQDFSNWSKPVDQFTINSKSYNAVYLNSFGTEIMKLYFNFDLGLIGFEDNSTGIKYNFERME